MKRRGFVLFLIFLGLSLVALPFLREQPIQPAMNRIKVPPALPMPSTKSSDLRQKKVEPLKVFHPEPTQTYADAVFFEVDENLAIFYDDIILGTLKNADGILSGVTIPERPQLWDLPISYAIAKTLADPQRVEAAIQYFNENTPVKFVPLVENEDGIVFVESEKHCRSYLGKHGSLQPIYLSPQCGPNEIIHELMHALGFIHEQSRTDRDSYVEILWNNIEPQQRGQFQKVPDLLMEAMNGSDFDFNSIMLYRPDIFAKKSGLPTMKSKSNDHINPSRNGLSPVDLARLERLYGPR